MHVLFGMHHLDDDDVLFRVELREQGVESVEDEPRGPVVQDDGGQPEFRLASRAGGGLAPREVAARCGRHNLSSSGRIAVRLTRIEAAAKTLRRRGRSAGRAENSPRPVKLSNLESVSSTFNMCSA